jgi:hypothetical protein
MGAVAMVVRRITEKRKIKNVTPVKIPSLTLKGEINQNTKIYPRTGWITEAGRDLV